jgi:hypothetical protein
MHIPGNSIKTMKQKQREMQAESDSQVPYLESLTSSPPIVPAGAISEKTQLT